MRCPECGFQVSENEDVCPRCLTRFSRSGERVTGNERGEGGLLSSLGLAPHGRDVSTGSWQREAGERAARRLQMAVTLFLLLVAAGVVGFVVAALTRRTATYYMDLAEGFYRNGRYEMALSEYLRALAQDPGLSAAESGVGLCYLRMGQPSLAIPHFEQALALDPGLVSALQGQGMAYNLVQMYPEAERSLKKVLEIRPDDFAASRELATVYFGQQRLEEAVELLEAVLRTRPDDALAQEYLGRSLQGMKRYDEALAPLQAAVDLSPDSQSARESLGRVAYELSRYDWALEQFRFLQSREPDNALWNAYIGICLSAAGDYEQAILHLNHALLLSQADLVLGQSHLHLGWSYYDQERYGESLVAFQRALIMAPRNPEAMAGVGWAYAELDRCDDAKALFEEALVIDPYLRVAQEGLEACQ